LLGADLLTFINVIFVGALTLVGRALLAAFMTDVARRAGTSIKFIRIFDRYTSFLFKHSVWSGEWEVNWAVNSPNFKKNNRDIVELSRCLNNIAMEASGTTTKGKKITYGFVGKLSRDKSIVTGTWFDRRKGGFGYHGSFQLKLAGSADKATGIWIGFSETAGNIKSGQMDWDKK